MLMSDRQCPICLDEILVEQEDDGRMGSESGQQEDANGSKDDTDIDAAVLDCKHVFHYSCLSHYIEVSFSFD